MITVHAIEAQHLADVGSFLNTNLNSRISAQDWAGSLSHGWAADQPNFGMQLRDDDRLVGVFCAIYSDQWIGGRLERFCNPHSWCVLEPYRSHGIALLLRLLKQPGFHFTMFTPNPKVAKVFAGLKFRCLDNAIVSFPNLPLPGAGPRAAFVERDPDKIAGRLSGTALAEFNAHRDIPWLKFAAFGVPDEACLVVYKPDRWKRMPCARILHVSDPLLFERYGSALRGHLLTTGPFLVSRIERRHLRRLPPLAHESDGTQPKLLLSSTLKDAEVSNLFSELVALDL